jgi:D-alanine--poly(phosphoribitol) ligase subunit 2
VDNYISTSPHLKILQCSLLPVKTLMLNRCGVYFVEATMITITDKVLNNLEAITGTDEVRRNLDTDLFGEKILDSFGTLELIVALSNELGIELSLGQVDRQAWATPRKIIADVEDRLHK